MITLDENCDTHNAFILHMFQKMLRVSCISNKAKQCYYKEILHRGPVRTVQGVSWSVQKLSNILFFKSRPITKVFHTLLGVYEYHCAEDTEHTSSIELPMPFSFSTVSHPPMLHFLLLIFHYNMQEHFKIVCHLTA